MTFPTVTTGSFIAEASSGTSHVGTLPAMAIGDCFIIGFGDDQTAVFTWPGGFTVGVAETASGSAIEAEMRYRIIDGTEAYYNGGAGGTVTITTDVAQAMSGVWIKAASGTYNGTPYFSSFVAASTANPNPPNLAPGVGALDFTWGVFVAWDAASGAPSLSSYPTNYANDQTSAVGGGAGSVSAAVATRDLNASSEDPGTFTLSGADDSLVATFAFEPAGSGAQTVTLGLITQTAVINSINVQGLFITLGLITQTASTFAPTIKLTVALGFIDQTATIAAPVVGTTGAAMVTLGLISQTAVITSLTSVANVTGVTLPLITITPIAYAPAITTTFSLAIGFINATASIFAPVVGLGAAPFVPGVPRNLTGAVEYVVEIYDSGASFGPNTKLGEIWDLRNLGWSKYDRLPGKGFLTLAQTSAILAQITPLTTHVAIYRCSSVADVLVYRGLIYDTDSTGDDVVLECFDYLALLSLSRAGFKTMYPTKKLGSEIASPEWALAKGATSSPLGFVTTGTIQDPLGTDAVTLIKTNAQWGTLDQLRLQLMYDLTEMGRANTTNQTTFEIDLTNTFNFWKNQNGASTSALVLGGNVSDYNYLPNWKRYRNNLATLGVAANGGPSEIVSTNATEITAKGLRQDVATLKTLAGIAGLTTEADQQKAALDRQLKHLTQQESTLMLRLLRGQFTPYTDGWINDQIPVEVSNGIDSITGSRRIIGMQARYGEYGEDLNVLLAAVAT